MNQKTTVQCYPPPADNRGRWAFQSALLGAVIGCTVSFAVPAQSPAMLPSEAAPKSAAGTPGPIIDAASKQTKYGDNPFSVRQTATDAVQSVTGLIGGDQGSGNAVSAGVASRLGEFDRNPFDVQQTSKDAGRAARDLTTDAVSGVVEIVRGPPEVPVVPPPPEVVDSSIPPPPASLDNPFLLGPPQRGDSEDNPFSQSRTATPPPDAYAAPAIGSPTQSAPVGTYYRPIPTPVYAPPVYRDAAQGNSQPAGSINSQPSRPTYLQPTITNGHVPAGPVTAPTPVSTRPSPAKPASPSKCPPGYPAGSAC